MGLIHGLFFILYLFNIIQNKIELGWETKKTLLAIFLSFIPFGAFYVAIKLIPAIVKAAINEENR